MSLKEKETESFHHKGELGVPFLALCAVGFLRSWRWGAAGVVQGKQTFYEHPEHPLLLTDT